MSTKIPKFGDPELLPKPKLERPSRRRMIYDASGRLKPNGPEFTEPPGTQPDIEGLPWKRIGFNSWTSEAQRTVVKNFLISFLATNSDAFNGWQVIERNTTQRQSVLRLPNPILVIRATRVGSDGFAEVSLDFLRHEREDLTQFEAKVALAGPALLAQIS